MDNLQKLATLGAQDEIGHRTHYKDKQTTHKPQHKKVKPTNQSGEPRNPGSRKSKQFLFLIRYMQCDSYSYNVLESTMRKQTKQHRK